MNLEIIQKNDNSLLHRKDIQAHMTFAGPTPSNDDVRLALATKLNTQKELVVVEHIYNVYGATEAKIFAKAYEKKEFIDKYEPKKKKPKKKPEGGGEAPTGAAPADGGKAEGPAAGAAPAEKPKGEAKPGGDAKDGKSGEKPAAQPKKGQTPAGASKSESTAKPEEKESK